MAGSLGLLPAHHPPKGLLWAQDRVSDIAGAQRLPPRSRQRLNLSLDCAGCGQPWPARLILYCTGPEKGPLRVTVKPSLAG